MIGRYGHDMYDRFDTELPPQRQSRPRVRIETETPARIPQRKKRKLISPNANQPPRDLDTLVKTLMLKNVNISVEEIAAQLDRASRTALIRITHIRAEFRHTLKFLKEHG